MSEPVKIQWKKDRDLTGGLLDMVCTAYSVSETSSTSSKLNRLTPEQKALKKKIESTGMGGLSFFAWFGFIGRYVSAEESREANRIERERKQARLENKDALEEVDKEEDEEDDVGMSLEIFPDGDDLAIAITEDLWPGAIKYFSELAYFYYAPENFVLPTTGRPANHQPNSAGTRTRRPLRRRLRIRRRRC